MKKNDLTGQRFGKLTAIRSYYDSSKKVTFWECVCDCGNTTAVRANRLVHHRTNSCGCLRAESNNHKKTTHGMSKTHLYNAWHSMKARCYNKNDVRYARYGGRGINVCDEWKQSFDAFKHWALANGYQEGLTLDRINNDEGYYPNNCRWVCTAVQNNNRGVSINITYDGKTQNLKDWCNELGVPYMRVWQRIKKYGYSFEEAIAEPSHNRSGKRKKET